MNEGKNKRKQVSKSARFEVFKRDAFKCQYCGRTEFLSEMEDAAG